MFHYIISTLTFRTSFDCCFVCIFHIPPRHTHANDDGKIHDAGPELVFVRLPALCRCVRVSSNSCAVNDRDDNSDDNGDDNGNDAIKWLWFNENCTILGEGGGVRSQMKVNTIHLK